MYGRSTACLLLMLFVLTMLLAGQADRQVRSSEALPDFHAWLPQHPEASASPFHNSLRRPVLSVASPGFPQISGAAGTIFSGTVTRIDHHVATSGQPVATVSITFHVEEAIRGVTPGENFTISQWIGLWSAGQRYRVGDPSKSLAATLNAIESSSDIGLLNSQVWISQNATVGVPITARVLSNGSPRSNVQVNFSIGWLGHSERRQRADQLGRIRLGHTQRESS